MATLCNFCLFSSGAVEGDSEISAYYSFEELGQLAQSLLHFFKSQLTGPAINDL